LYASRRSSTLSSGYICLHTLLTFRACYMSSRLIFLSFYYLIVSEDCGDLEVLNYYEILQSTFSFHFTNSYHYNTPKHTCSTRPVLSRLICTRSWQKMLLKYLFLGHLFQTILLRTYTIFMLSNFTYSPHYSTGFVLIVGRASLFCADAVTFNALSDILLHITSIKYVQIYSQNIIIIIINIKDWTLWSVPSPELQLFSPTFG